MARVEEEKRCDGCQRGPLCKICVILHAKKHQKEKAEKMTGRRKEEGRKEKEKRGAKRKEGEDDDDERSGRRKEGDETTEGMAKEEAGRRRQR